MTEKQKLFIIWDRRDGHQPPPNYWTDGGGYRHKVQPPPAGKPTVTDEGLFISDGIIGKVGLDNVYLRTYPDFSEARWPKGCSKLDDLEVGQSVETVWYKLSDSAGCYDIYRVQ